MNQTEIKVKLNTTAKEHPEHTYVGVDIAKKSFVACMRGKTKTYGNHPDGWRKFTEALAKLPGEVLVCYESTGSLTWDFTERLLEAGVKQRCLCPTHIRRYAEGIKLLAKTDPVDSKVITIYAQHMGVVADETISKDLIQLKRLDSLREHMNEGMVRAKNALKAHSDEFSRDQLQANIEMYKQSIKDIEAEMKRIIAADENLAALYKFYTSEDGIGKVNAVVLTAQMPEMGEMTRKEAGALVGAAPYNKDSGNSSGKRHARGGRRRVRCMLFMSCVGLLHCKGDNEIKRFYKRLKAKGKPAKVALNACVRKWAVILNARVRDFKASKNGCNGTLPPEGGGEAA